MQSADCVALLVACMHFWNSCMWSCGAAAGKCMASLTPTIAASPYADTASQLRRFLLTWAHTAQHDQPLRGSRSAIEEDGPEAGWRCAPTGALPQYTHTNAASARVQRPLQRCSRTHTARAAPQVWAPAGAANRHTGPALPNRCALRKVWAPAGAAIRHTGPASYVVMWYGMWYVCGSKK